MADEHDEQKPPGAGDDAEAAGRETAVDHSVVDEGAQDTSVRAVPDEPPAAAGQETSVREVPPEPEPEPAPVEEPPADEPAPVAAPVPDTTATATYSSPPAPDPGPPPAAAPYQPAGGTSPAAADREASESHDSFEERPELFIGGAFVGAFVIGQILKRLTRGGG
jgi:protein TonB